MTKYTQGVQSNLNYNRSVFNMAIAFKLFFLLHIEPYKTNYITFPLKTKNMKTVSFIKSISTTQTSKGIDQSCKLIY